MGGVGVGRTRLYRSVGPVGGWVIGCAGWLCEHYNCRSAVPSIKMIDS